MDDKDIMDNMFSSFVKRKTALPPAAIDAQNKLPPLRAPRNLHPYSRPHARSTPTFLSQASSSHNNHPTSRAPTFGLNAPAATSDSMEAITAETTPVAAPHQCSKCTKAFRQRSQLVRHYTRVHEKRKPFSCAHCNKSFASAFDRKRHVEAVHGRRCVEFFCDRCKFHSKHEKDLTEHIKRVHERDACRICGKVFKRNANLVAHERHYHSKNHRDISEW